MLSAQAQERPLPHYGPYEQASPEQFVGNWLRSDGTYRFEITQNLVGDLEVKYFNPAPINVESVTVAPQGDLLELTIVLRDSGYDGSTYRLMYSPAHYVMFGSYTIPGQQPTAVHFTQE